MTTMTATELARNLKKALDRVAFAGEEILVVRNNQKIARLLPGPATLTALEAMADLYRSLPEDAARDWLADSRMPEKLADEMEDPWGS